MVVRNWRILFACSSFSALIIRAFIGRPVLFQVWWIYSIVFRISAPGACEHFIQRLSITLFSSNNKQHIEMVSLQNECGCMWNDMQISCAKCLWHGLWGTQWTNGTAPVYVYRMHKPWIHITRTISHTHQTNSKRQELFIYLPLANKKRNAIENRQQFNKT